MVKHIVMWRLKESAHGNDKITNALLIKEKLEALRGKIPGLLSIVVGINCSEAPGCSDLVLYSEFESREALDNYQANPLHTVIAPFVGGATEERRMVDFEI